MRRGGGTNLQRALQSAFGRASVQRRVRRADGAQIVMEIELIGLGDGNVLFVGHDITERVEMAERLERERQRLQLAQTVSHIGSGEIHLISGALWWSDEMFRLFGFEPAETPPAFELIWERVHPDDRAMARATTQRVQQGIGHAPFVFRVVLPDGTTPAPAPALGDRARRGRRRGARHARGLRRHGATGGAG